MGKEKSEFEFQEQELMDHEDILAAVECVFDGLRGLQRVLRKRLSARRARFRKIVRDRAK